MPEMSTQKLGHETASDLQAFYAPFCASAASAPMVNVIYRESERGMWDRHWRTTSKVCSFGLPYGASAMPPMPEHSGGIN